MKEISLSPLGHTWILDLDGTLVKHNGYKIDGIDSFLPGAKEFLDSIPQEDFIVFITSRTVDFQNQTEGFLRDNNVRYNTIIFGAPYGERILLNDSKPSGLQCSIAVNLVRNSPSFPQLSIKENL